MTDNPSGSRTEKASKPLTYRRAGVDVVSAEALVGRLRALAATTQGEQVRTQTAAYAGLYELPGGELLAASCDGVGTKLLIAQALGRYHELGQDLVAMNVNDLLPSGARPLFFLDYLATGRLDDKVLTELVAGMADACRSVQCALLGGETAEMPGVYGPEGFDIAGFAVGMTEARRLPKRERLAAGDVVLALPSTGVHANGLSLARQALRRTGLVLTDTVPRLDRRIGEALLVPTTLYVKPVLQAFDREDVVAEIHAAAHITGGGLLGRAQALLPPRLRMVIDSSCYLRPPIFDVIADSGAISQDEMARTFNMGLGFLLVASQKGAALLVEAPGSPWLTVGELQHGETGVDLGYARSEAG